MLEISRATPAHVIPRLLARNDLRYADVHLWEIHEAFSGQVLYQLKALETPSFLRDKAKVDVELGQVPRDRINPKSSRQWGTARAPRPKRAPRDARVVGC